MVVTCDDRAHIMSAFVRFFYVTLCDFDPSGARKPSFLLSFTYQI